MIFLILLPVVVSSTNRRDILYASRGGTNHIQPKHIYPSCEHTGYGPREIFRALPIGDYDEEPAFVTSLSVEEKLTVLQKLSKTGTRRAVHTLTHSSALFPRFSPAQIVYAQYNEQILYAEAGIIRLIARHAYNKLRGAESSLSTASELAEHLKRTFREKYDYDLNFLTPQTIAAYRNMLHAHMYKSRENRPGLEDTDIILFGVADWRARIIEPRISNLARTGYEF